MKVTKRQLRRIIREAVINEALPPHLKKHFNKDGSAKAHNPMGYEIKDVTPAGYGPDDSVRLQKGDKVVVSEDGLFRFAKTASHNMKELENKLHDALRAGAIGTVIMMVPNQGVRVEFDGYALDVYDWMLEKV